MTKMLIVFIDGFPHAQLQKTPFLNALATTAPLTPGFGYSVNLHMELFAGKTPDDIGYFGEWTMRRDPQPRNFLDRLVPLLGLVERLSPFAEKVLHYGLRRFFRWDTAYIPFGILQLFEKRGRYPLMGESPVETLIEKYAFQTAIGDQVRAGTGKKDEPTIRKAQALIDAGHTRVFVSLCDLDGISHDYGVNSPYYDERLAMLDRTVEELQARFVKQHPEGVMVVISDHGMANADTAVDLQLDKHFGPPKAGRLVYFHDSLYLSIWTNDPAIRAKAEQLLADHPEGRVLSQEERERYGVTSPRFGDLIYLLNEGYAFNPNFFGYRMLKAYHGYHPETPSQKGIFLANLPLAQAPEQNRDVYATLDELLGAKVTVG